MTLISLNLLLLVLTSAANLCLGIIVYIKNRSAYLNRIILALTINASLWGLAVTMILVHDDYASLLFWIRVSHAVAIFIPWHLYAISVTFPKNNPFCFKGSILSLISCTAMALLSLSPWLVKGIAEPVLEKQQIFTPLIYLYAGLFVLLTAAALITMYKKLQSARGLHRSQLQILISSITISVLLASLCNLFLPTTAFLAILDIRPFGPVFSIVMVIGVSYAIARYRLMDIHFALRKCIAFVATVMIMSGSFLIFVQLLIWLGVSFNQAFFNFITVVLVFFVAATFGPLKEFIQPRIDHFFYPDVHNYHVKLMRESSRLTSYLNLNELLHFFVSNLFHVMRLECSCFFLRKKDGRYHLGMAKGLNKERLAQAEGMAIPADNPLIVYLALQGEPLLVTDLTGLRLGDKREVLRAEMENLGAEAVFPILIEDNLEGVVFLGPKTSGEPYFTDDASLLSVQAYQVAAALKNAQLYQEVVGITQYLESILENMGNGLIAVDNQGRITTFNAGAESLICRPAEKVLGKMIEEALSPSLYTLLRWTLDSGQGIHGFEVELSTGESTIFLSCNTAFMDLPPTEKRGAIMVLSDITRVKELEKVKSQSQRLISLGELAAGMAHEIKNPLVSIKTFAELLPEKYENKEFREDFSQVVIKEIERINKLVMELLSFSKDSQFNYEEIDIRVLMDEILFLLLPQLNAQEIEVIKSYEPGIFMVQADPHQLKQALLNICLNSVEAMAGGGKLWVEIHPSAMISKDGDINAMAHGVKVLIKDNGTGISTAIRDMIFDPFFTTKASGSGIGLSLSYRIITDHRGTIQYYNHNGKGTVFEINLPLVNTES